LKSEDADIALEVDEERAVLCRRSRLRESERVRVLVTGGGGAVLRWAVERWTHRLGPGYPQLPVRLLLPLLLIPAVAWADVAPPPGGYPAETCSIDRVRKPGEDCTTCTGNLSQSENDCLSPKPGYGKRCATRRQGTTWEEVWCASVVDAAVAPAPKPPPPSKLDAAVAPELEAPPPAKARGKGCQVAGGGGSGGPVPLIVLLSVLGWLRRAR
jgi:hypothetical protein